MKKVLILLGILGISVLAGRAVLQGRYEGSGAGEVSGVGTQVGQKAPDFSIVDFSGEPISLSDFLGQKVLVVTSTATWCPTCIIEAKEFSPVYEQFKDEGVEFLSVSIDPTDNDNKLSDFQEKYGAPWPHTHPGEKGVDKMILDYELTRFEITYVIDKEGVIRFKDSRITSEDILEEELRKVLGDA